jgi:hypothetical protein
MDFRETFREIWIGSIYMFDKIRGKEPKPDLGIIRENHYESAFGRQRPLPGKPQRSRRVPRRKEKGDSPVFPVVEIEADQEFETNGHKQWLSLGKYDRFNNPRRDRSEGLQEQIERELEKRGYPRRAEFFCLLHVHELIQFLQTWIREVRVKRLTYTQVAFNRGGGTSTIVYLNLDKKREKQRTNRLRDANHLALAMIPTIDSLPAGSLPVELTLCEPLTPRVMTAISSLVEWMISYP